MNKQPFRFQGREVFGDIKTQTPKSVPDADSKTLEEYHIKMRHLFGDTKLPAMIYKGCTYPPRELGEFLSLTE